MDAALSPHFERFDHVALAARSIRDVVPLIELLGGTYRNGGQSAGSGFRWAQFDLPGGVKLEVLEPATADSFLHSFLEDRGPGVHHVTMKVRDLAAAVEAARAAGFEVVGVDTSSPHWKEAFIHPRSAAGTVVQLAEWDDQRRLPDWSLEDVLAGRAMDDV